MIVMMMIVMMMISDRTVFDKTDTMKILKSAVDMHSNDIQC